MGQAWHGITYHGSGHWIVTRRSTPSGNDESSVLIPALQQCARARCRGGHSGQGLSFGNLGPNRPALWRLHTKGKRQHSDARRAVGRLSGGRHCSVAWHGRSVLAANTPCALLSTACLALPAM